MSSVDGTIHTISIDINEDGIDSSDQYDVSVPVDADPTTNSISEAAENGDLVGITASASDLDTENNTVTYTLSDDSGGRFAIDATTGVVSVANATLLDYETAVSHDITVLASSSDGSTASETFHHQCRQLADDDALSATAKDGSANPSWERDHVDDFYPGTVMGIAGDGSISGCRYYLCNF